MTHPTLVRRLSGAGRRVLLALAPLLVVVGIPGALEFWEKPDPGFTPRETTVGVVDPGGPAAQAGVRAGDALRALNGHPIRHAGAYWARLHTLAVGDTLTLTLERSGVRATVDYVLPPSPTRVRLRRLLMSLVGLSFLFLGFITYLRRPDPLGRWFYLTCVLLSYSLLPLPTFPWVGLMQVLESVRSVLQLLLPAVFLRFFLIFPEGAPDDAGVRRRHRWWMVPPLALAPLHIAFNFSSRVEMRWVDTLQIVSAVMFAAYLVVALLVFLRKTRRRDRWDRWIRLRLAVLGLATGLLPFVVATVVRQVTPGHSGPDWITLLLLPLVPAAFSLALLRTGAIDLPTVIRQSIIGIVLTLPALVVAGLLVSGRGPLEPIGELRYVVAVVATFGAAILAVPLRQHVGALVDRVFYPEQRRIREAAARLDERLAELRQPSEVAEALCHGAVDLFRARSVSLYGWPPDAPRPLLAYAGPPPTPPSALAPGTRLAQTAVESHGLVLVEPLLTGRTPLRLDDDSRRLLDTTDAVLLCPLVSAGHTVGILALGPPVDGGSYGNLELYHVELLARRAATSLDNALLHETDLQRERVQVELELAREIQANLLPAESLVRDDAEVQARMIPSREVGGDLYDFFELGDGRIVLAVADAAGKGVPASLLGSGIRTALREVVRPGVECADALAGLNRDVLGMTGDRHFVALFLGLFTPATGVLEYGAAGIEPPLWVRAGLGRVERLTKGGPVLGVAPAARFQAGLVRLAPGDTVLAFSDGMVDEDDAEEEPFGYDRLSDLARSRAHDSVPTLLDGLMRAVEDFGVGEATDDRTLLVLRVPPQGTETAAAMG